jgi:hypothetical protein
MLNAGAKSEASSRRHQDNAEEKTMSAISNPVSARPQVVATAVTALVAGWFFLSAGAIVADAASPRAAPGAQMATRTAGTLASADAASTLAGAGEGDEGAVSPEGRLKLTVVAQRPHAENPTLRTAATRHAPNL